MVGFSLTKMSIFNGILAANRPSNIFITPGPLSALCYIEIYLSIEVSPFSSGPVSGGSLMRLERVEIPFLLNCPVTSFMHSHVSLAPWQM